MARINIDDQFWLDYVDVLEKVPNVGQDKIIGNAIRFFRFAQEQHIKGKYVSEESFKQKGFLEELIPTFATRTPYGIKAVGSDKYFNWLKNKQEAGKAGGIKSGEARRSKTKQNEANSRYPKQAEPSDSDSYYDSTKDSLDTKKVKVKKDNVVVGAAPEKIISEEELIKEMVIDLENDERSPSTRLPGDLSKKTAIKPTTHRFEVIEELKKDSKLAEVLQRISPAVQKSWVERYETSWLITTLRNCIDHYLVQENALNVAQINEWGSKLAGWLRREKKPRLRSNKKNLNDMVREFEDAIAHEKEFSHDD